MAVGVRAHQQGEEIREIDDSVWSSHRKSNFFTRPPASRARAIPLAALCLRNNSDTELASGSQAAMMAREDLRKGDVFFFFSVFFPRRLRCNGGGDLDDAQGRSNGCAHPSNSLPATCVSPRVTGKNKGISTRHSAAKQAWMCGAQHSDSRFSATAAPTVSGSSSGTWLSVASHNKLWITLLRCPTRQRERRNVIFSWPARKTKQKKKAKKKKNPSSKI